MSEDRVIARVGAREIKQSEMDQLRSALGEQAAMFDGPEGKAHLRDEMIRQELLYLDAKEKNMAEDPEFRALMEQVEKEQLQQFALRQLLAKVQVAPFEVESYYEANKERFTPEEQKDKDALMQRLYMQLILMRQQSSYVAYTDDLEKKYDVTRLEESE